MRTMKLAIIGSHVSPGPDWERGVRTYIAMQLKLWTPGLVISGGAPCVDRWAIEIANSWGYVTKEFPPVVHEWEDRDGKEGFRSRNIRIVRECTHLLRLAKTKRGSGGSVWTMSYAIGLLRPTKNVIITNAGQIHSTKLFHFPDNENTPTGRDRFGREI